MKKTSYKNKIILLSGILVLAIAGLFGYFFNLLDKSNAAVVDKILIQKKELLELQAEQRNFELSKQDLNLLASRPYKPDNFFSQDITLVKEIKELEGFASATKVDLTLSVAGTIDTAVKAKTVGEIYQIPYTIQVKGRFANIVAFLKTLEKTDYVTHLTSVNVNTVSSSEVNAVFTGLFYIKK